MAARGTCTVAPRIVIALCGPRRCGKDTIANLLCERHGYANRKFAAPLKRTLADLFGFSDDEVEGPAKDVVHPAWGVTPRRLLQWLGTDVMQFQLQQVVPAVGRTFWAQRMVHTLVHEDASVHRVVISDVRFPHEIAALRELALSAAASPPVAVVTVRLERAAACLHVSEDGHCSEQDARTLHTDVVVRNDGTPEQAVEQVLAAVTRALKSA